MKVINCRIAISFSFLKKFLFYCFAFLTLTIPISGQVQSEIFLKGAAVTDVDEEDGFLWVATY